MKDVDSRVFTQMLCGKNLTRWPWKSIGFQILLKTKYVPSLVKIHWRMLILECSQGCYGRTEGRTDGSITISLRNFVGEGINITTTVIRVVMAMLFNATYNNISVISWSVLLVEETGVPVKTTNLSHNVVSSTPRQ